MNPTLSSVLLGTAGLWASAAVALILTILRPLKSLPPRLRETTLRLVLLGIALHCLHFSEEFLTGFQVRFPSLLGLQPWFLEFFVPFNLAWIAIWALSAAGFSKGMRAALFPLWFLGVAMLANGAIHPLLAVGSGGYFPGLISSPLTGWLGILLCRRLWRCGGDFERA